MPAPADDVVMPHGNIASHLSLRAAENPDGRAVVAWERGRWRSRTFAQLDAESDALARGFTRLGVRRGMRVVVMAPPSPDFFAAVSALLKLGAVLVLVDPGLGRRSVLRCLESIAAEAFVGVSAAHLARVFFPRPFRTVRILATIGPKIPGSGPTLQGLHDPGPFVIAPTAPDDPAAILFTSGVTGLPKGAVFTHGNLQAQVEVLRRTYGIAPGEVDLSTFAPFALFAPALGVTSVIPDMDTGAPARADPVKLAHAIFTQGCTTMFGSPALLDKLSRWAQKTDVRFNTLERVICAGAPVRFDILDRMAGRLRLGAQVFTPYGATEALPVTNVGSDEVLAETAARTLQGHGICVGRPVDGVDVRVVPPTDGPIDRWSDELVLPAGAIGEIVVRGPVVSRSYWGSEETNRLAKIRAGGDVLHRMGDVGYFDDRGRLWICGRKDERVRTASGDLFPLAVEPIFDQHPAVRRTALVGVKPAGSHIPVLVVEKEPEARIRPDVLAAELLALGERHDASRDVRHVLVYPGTFPVDARHEAKIQRAVLASWAAKRLDGRRG